MAAANKGKKQSKERIAHRVSLCNLKREETKIKQSNSLKGHITTTETRNLISEKLLGKKKSESHIAHIKESHIGIKQSEQTKLKISNKMKIIRKGQPSNMLGKRHSEETKQKMSIAAKNRKTKV